MRIDFGNHGVCVHAVYHARLLERFAAGGGTAEAVHNIEPSACLTTSPICGMNSSITSQSQTDKSNPFIAVHIENFTDFGFFGDLHTEFLHNKMIHVIVPQTQANINRNFTKNLPFLHERANRMQNEFFAKKA